MVFHQHHLEVSQLKAPKDREGLLVAAGNCYRGEMWVAEIKTINYDSGYRTYVVSYSIAGTMAGGLCSIKSFLDHFPYRVELRPMDDLSLSNPNQERKVA